MNDEQPTKHTWQTTERVVQEFGFDPRPYAEKVLAGSRFIRNKLMSDMRRVYLKDDVIRVVPEVQKEQAQKQEIEQANRIFASMKLRGYIGPRS